MIEALIGVSVTHTCMALSLGDASIQGPHSGPKGLPNTFGISAWVGEIDLPTIMNEFV